MSQSDESPVVHLRDAYTDLQAIARTDPEIARLTGVAQALDAIRSAGAETIQFLRLFHLRQAEAFAANLPVHGEPDKP